VHEVQRYAILHNINTDVGRGRAWLRASLNERTLERALLRLTSSRQLLQYVVLFFSCRGATSARLKVAALLRLRLIDTH